MLLAELPHELLAMIISAADLRSAGRALLALGRQGKVVREKAEGGVEVKVKAAVALSLSDIYLSPDSRSAVSRKLALKARSLLRESALKRSPDAGSGWEELGPEDAWIGLAERRTSVRFTQPAMDFYAAPNFGHHEFWPEQYRHVEGLVEDCDMERVAKEMYAGAEVMTSMVEKVTLLAESSFRWTLPPDFDHDGYFTAEYEDVCIYSVPDARGGRGQVAILLCHGRVIPEDSRYGVSHDERCGEEYYAWPPRCECSSTAFLTIEVLLPGHAMITALAASHEYIAPHKHYFQAAKPAVELPSETENALLAAAIGIDAQHVGVFLRTLVELSDRPGCCCGRILAELELHHKGGRLRELVGSHDFLWDLNWMCGADPERPLMGSFTLNFPSDTGLHTAAKEARCNEEGASRRALLAPSTGEASSSCWPIDDVNDVEDEGPWSVVVKATRELRGGRWAAQEEGEAGKEGEGNPLQKARTGQMAPVSHAELRRRLLARRARKRSRELRYGVEDDEAMEQEEEERLRGGRHGVGRKEVLPWFTSLPSGAVSSLASLLAAVRCSPLGPTMLYRPSLLHETNAFPELLTLRGAADRLEKVPRDLQGYGASKLRTFDTESLLELCRQRGIDVDRETERADAWVARLVAFKRLAVWLWEPHPPRRAWPSPAW